MKEEFRTEARKLAILQALDQVMTYRFVIKLYTAWILPTTNVQGKSYGDDATEPLDCSIVLTLLRLDEMQ